MPYGQGGLLESGARLLESEPIFPLCPMTMERSALCTPISSCYERGLVSEFPLSHSPTHIYTPVPPKRIPERVAALHSESRWSNWLSNQFSFITSLSISPGEKCGHTRHGDRERAGVHRRLWEMPHITLLSSLGRPLCVSGPLGDYLACTLPPHTPSKAVWSLLGLLRPAEKGQTTS